MRSTRFSSNSSMAAVSVFKMPSREVSRFRPWLLLVTLSVVFVAWIRGRDILELTKGKDVLCEQPHMIFRMVSYDPFIAHIENFVTGSERRYLLDLTEGQYSQSMMRGDNGSVYTTEARTSSTGFLPRDDRTVNCIMRRAAEIQGYLPLIQIETPQITYYEREQQYQEHYDWDTDDEGIVYDREATIFAILDYECSNCGTHFPELEVDWIARSVHWCRLFECSNSTLITRPMAGSALFWRNTYSDGTGDERTLHAGLPVAEGFKAGLNVWTSVLRKA